MMVYNSKTVELEWAGKKLLLEIGRMAKLANGAAMAKYGDTVVLATAVASKEVKEGIDFLPLTVDYQEKAYAAGKIPGSFFRREGRPSEKEVLTSRLIDRPLRPLFPEGFYNEVQIITSVLSVDEGNCSDFLGIIAASAALVVSDIPFREAVGAVRIGRINNEFVVNPTLEDTEKSDLNLVVAGTRDAVMMVEGSSNELPEEVLLEAIDLARQEIQKVVELQNKLQEFTGKSKRTVPPIEINSMLREKVHAGVTDRIKETILIPNKTERQTRLDNILAELIEQLKGGETDNTRDTSIVFHEIEKNEVRRMILGKDRRADGRSPLDIRPIVCEVGVLPRTHGSALFTRGETQSLAAVTLGTAEDEQRIDALEGESTKSFMLHYNFPPFSVGEARPLRSPGRREIGHGALAEKALRPVIPSKEEFPYTVRIVSDILESNGSSSMATVCGGTLALMDAGVPIKEPVAGIAMGLIKERDRIVILSDILGLEDHLGDMDFKVTGTKNGITALQMDIKIGGITREIMEKALAQAKEGRLYILSRMFEAIERPRLQLSLYAPRVFTIQIKKDRVGDVIGPGGKVIRGIIEKTGVKIDIDDSGLVSIASSDEASAKEAIDLINKITEEVEVGKIYLGKVKKIMDFGALVEILPNVTGLVHISQLAHQRVASVSDVVSEGEEIMVKVLEVDKQGRIRLSRKDALHAEKKELKNR